MPEVRCADVGADTCQAHFEAESKSELIRKVAKHLRQVHKVDPPNQTFLTHYAKHSH